MSRIVIDPARTLGTIDRKVFAGSSSTWAGASTAACTRRGHRCRTSAASAADALALLRELRLGVLRWPGGNFVSNYHWTDGIGP